MIARNVKHVAQLLLLLLILLAPWPFGGAPAWTQPWLFGGILAAAGVWIVLSLIERSGQSILVPLELLPLAGFILVGVVQLVPRPTTFEFTRAEFVSVLEGTSSRPLVETGSLSLYPASTRFEVSRLCIAAMAFLLGANLFRSPASRGVLLHVLTICGVAVAFFGLVQKLSWNGKLFWTVDLRYGGQPFASFVNRNNAAGFLNLCCAASFALLISHGTRLWRNDRDFNQSSGFRDRQITWLAGYALATFVIAAGVVSSLSRGGILGLCLASLAVGVVLTRRHRWKVVSGVAVIAVIAVVGFVNWLGFEGGLKQRLTTLTAGQFLAESRLPHWKETLRAVPDAPVTGFGLGTYRYVNRVYQSSPQLGWYVHADNQYLETLIETGFVGLACVLLGLVLLGRLAIRVVRIGRSEGDLGLAAAILFLLISQAFQAGTDFGIVITANLLVGCLFLGSLSAKSAGTEFQAIDLSPKPQRGFWLACAVGITLIPTSGVCWSEIWRTAQSSRWIESIPNLDRAQSVDPARVGILLVEGEAVANRRRDDADLHERLGRLWVERYRQQTFEALASQSRTSGRSPTHLWERTSLNQLHRVASEALKANNTRFLEGLSANEAIWSSLQNAAGHFRAARASCPVYPETHLSLAHLLVLFDRNQNESESRLLHEAALFTPYSPHSLAEIGTSADHAGLPRLAARCRHRAYSLRPEWAIRDLDPLISELGARRVFEEVLSDEIPVLLEFAARVKEKHPALLAQTIQRIEGLLSAQSGTQLTSATLTIQGRLALLEGDTDQALALYLQAAEDSPLSIDPRVAAAEILEARGEFAAAVELVSAASRLSPKSNGLRTWLSRLIERKLREPADPEPIETVPRPDP